MTPRILCTIFVLIVVALLVWLHVHPLVGPDRCPVIDAREDVVRFPTIPPTTTTSTTTSSTTTTTVPRVSRPRTPTARSAPIMRAASVGVWDELAGCESGGDWAANTGNGFYGGLQFDAQTWHANGGAGLPHQHSRGEQIAVAERVRAARGFWPWPSCARKLGLL